MSNKPDRNEPQYGIGAVARMTGLTDHTIRVWERRYGAVVAERATNGRRRYSDADVEKLGLLKRLTDEGVAISQVASLPSEELRSRTQTIRNAHEPELPARVDIAVLGDFLPMQLMEQALELDPVRLAISDSSKERFVADLGRHRADVVVFESNVLDSDTLATLQTFMRDCQAVAGVILYKFGASRDTERARDLGIHLLRAPADIESIRSAVLRAATSSPRDHRKTGPQPAEQTYAGLDAGSAEIPLRLFTATQLARLSKVSTDIDCECPSQLAALVNELTAFEVYSANCANRSEDDEKLHRYLHARSAEARAIIEEALQAVIRCEGISV